MACVKLYSAYDQVAILPSACVWSKKRSSLSSRARCSMRACDDHVLLFRDTVGILVESAVS